MRRALLLWASLLAACVCLAPALALAQDDENPLANPDTGKQDGEETVVTEEEFVPALEHGVWEVGLQFGSMNLAQTLVQAKRILVDYEQDDTSALFADMTLEGQSSFAPALRLSYVWGRLALDNSLGFALGDYQQVIQGPVIAPNIDTENVLSDNEIKKGSYFVWFHDSALSYYVLTRGRVLPFVSVGAGSQHFFLDSPSYVDGIANSLSFSFGGGVRIIGDQLFSVRIEAREFIQEVQFDARDAFLEDQPNPDTNAPVGERLIDIPLTQLDAAGTAQHFADKFDKDKFSNLWLSVGVVAAF